MDDLLQEMIRPAGPTARDRARRRRLVVSAATVGLAVIGVTTLTTSALFTDNDSATGSAFTTGSVDISNTPATTVLESLNLAPGDKVFGPLTVTNSGSLAFRYAVGYAFTNTDTIAGAVVGTTGTSLLSSQLSLTIQEVASAAGCPAGGPAGGAPLATVAVGAAVLADTDIIGTRGTGGGNGELELAAGGATDVLCVGVEMSNAAGNEYQLTSANLTLFLNAEQTANN